MNIDYLQWRFDRLKKKRDEAKKEMNKAYKTYSKRPTEENLCIYDTKRKKYRAIVDSTNKARYKLNRARG